MNSFLAVLFLLLATFQLGQSLRCYQHALCTTNCPALSSLAPVECSPGQDRCWTVERPTGTERGCGAADCPVEVSSGVTNADVCCRTNLCNAARAMQMNRITMMLMITGLFAFFYFSGQRY